MYLVTLEKALEVFFGFASTSFPAFMAASLQKERVEGV